MTNRRRNQLVLWARVGVGVLLSATFVAIMYAAEAWWSPRLLVLLGVLVVAWGGIAFTQWRGSRELDAVDDELTAAGAEAVDEPRVPILPLWPTDPQEIAAAVVALALIVLAFVAYFTRNR